LQQNSAEISSRMVDQIERMLAGIRWSRADVEAFVGAYLTEPKSHVFFDPPEEPLSRKRFDTALRACGFALDPRSLLLFSAAGFHLNGEPLEIDAALRDTLAALAHRRALPANAFADAPDGLTELLYGWYENGFGAPAAA